MYLWLWSVRLSRQSKALNGSVREACSLCPLCPLFAITLRAVNVWHGMSDHILDTIRTARQTKINLILHAQSFRDTCRIVHVAAACFE